MWLLLIAIATAEPATLPADAQRERRAEECQSDSNVEVVDHAITISVRGAPLSLEGTGTVRVRARRDAEFVVLDAHDLAVTRVVAQSHPLPFRSTNRHLCVKLTKALRAGDEMSLDLAWQVATGRDTPRASADQVWAGYDAAAWMPTIQDSATRATLRLRINAPSGWKAIASGKAAGHSRAADGQEVYDFALHRPSPPFLYAFAVGLFDEATLDVDGVKLRALGPVGDDVSHALAVTAEMLLFFRRKIGVPFPGDSYGQAFVRGDAAQEAAGFSLLSARALSELRAEPSEDWLFSHELAHQWFAWLVPCLDFADFWLNEGFATFMVAAVKEQRFGRAAYERELALWRKRSAKVHADGRDAPLSLAPPGVPRPHLDDNELQPRGVTYARGALVLDKLRTLLGDAVFWRGVQHYVEKRAGKGASSEDLRLAFEAVSGRDLRPFFAQYVYQPAPAI